MTIGVTDTMGPEHKFLRYVDWLRGASPAAACLKLSYADGNAAALDRCDALVLTGGHDVDPALYETAGARTGPGRGAESTDRRRDDFELGLLRRALERPMPLLAICRGLQLTNVAFGGTLIADLESAGYPPHRAAKGECRHDVGASPGSFLAACTQAARGSVNSSHHQAAGTIGRGLVVTARSADGVVEAIERDPAGAHAGDGGGFFLLIQWHPERMDDPSNPFADGIRKRFFSSIDLMNTH